MKSSTSTLNPYATSYVPISKRDMNNEVKDFKTLSLSGEAAVSVPQAANMDDYKLKGQQVDAAYGTSSERSQEIDSKFVDEESEMDLAYLQMMFPGVSDQSLADVYNVNSGDLDAAFDMLTNLESADNLPDALDIERPEVPVSSGECSSVKAVKVTAESGSASCPSESAVAT